MASHHLAHDMELVTRNVEQLREDGYVLLEGLLPPDFTRDLYAAYQQRIEAGVSYDGGLGRIHDVGGIAYVDSPLTLHANAVSYAVFEPIIHIIEGYLGEPVVLSYVVSYRTQAVRDPSKVRAMEETAGTFHGWHSDINVKLRGYRAVVAMLYLNDVLPGGGGMHLIRGSHRYGGEKRAWSLQEVEERRQDIVEICAPAGSVIVFDMEMVHGAGVPTQVPRDVFRCCYAPEWGFREPLVFSSDSLPAQISPRVARLLRIGQASSEPLLVSQGLPKPPPPSLRRLLGRARRRLVKVFPVRSKMG